MKTESRVSPLDVLWMCVVLVIIAVAAGAETETDVWGHIRFGLDMLDTHRLPVVDPYSFTSTQRWINHEWLSQLLYAGAYRLGDLPALLVLRALAAGVLLAVLTRATRRLPWTWRVIVVAGVVVVGIAQLRAVRPQVFSMVLYSLLLVGLKADAIWLPALFVAWANIHGGWLMGICGVAAHALLSPTRKRWFLAAACAAATLANPYGVQLWMALADALARGWHDVAEWQPIWRLEIGADPLLLWLVTTVAVAWGLTHSTGIGRFDLLWTMAVAVAAARAHRLLGFYALTAAVCVMARMRVPDRAAPAIGWDRRSIALSATAAVFAVAMSTLLVARSVRCLPPASPPISPEAAAVSYIQRAQLHGRTLMWFDWGLYAIWHVGNQMTVSIDNRRETVYSDDVVRRHIAFYEGLDDAYPDALVADYVWLPVALPVVENLRHRGWQLLFEGPRSALLGRTAAAPEQSTVPSPVGACFPNP
jgi:hypothetical protein